MKSFISKIIPFVFGGFFVYIAIVISRKLSISNNVRGVMDSILSYPITVKDNNPVTLGKILIGVFLMILGQYCSRFISNKIAKDVLPKFKLDQGAIAAIKNLIFYIFNVIFAIFALHVANVPLTAFTVVGGALAIGVGFGSQNLMSNFISGLILQIERPIQVGDMIELEGTRGTVEQIGARRTIIRATNGVALIYPNGYFLEKKLSSYSFLSTKVRSDVKLIVPVGTDVNELKGFVEKTLDSYPEVLKQPGPTLYFIDYIDSAPFIVLSASYWVDIRLSSKSELESRIRYAVYNELQRVKASILN
jgi:potassium efflux system protein